MIHASELKIPFDVAASRTIKYDLEVEVASKAQKEIVAQIKAADDNPDEADNPISIAVNLGSLKKSNDPQSAFNSQIISLLDDLRGQMNSLTGEMEVVKNILVSPYLYTFQSPGLSSVLHPIYRGASASRESDNITIAEFIKNKELKYGAEENITSEKKPQSKPKDHSPDEGQD